MTSSGAKPPGLRLTLRDLSLLLALFTARYLTTEQIVQLFWRESKGGRWGRIKAGQHRLRLLWQHGYVRRIEVPVKRGERPHPYIYALDRKGAELLVSEYGIKPAEIDWRPKAHEAHYPFMAHLLATTDFHIALELACAACGVSLEEWVDEKELRSAEKIHYVTLEGPQGGQMRTALVPDAYFKLCRQGRCGVFHLEIDLVNVTIAPSIWERRSIKKTCRSYIALFQSESYRQRYEGRRGRVLYVSPSSLRLKHLKQAVEDVFEELKRAGEDTSDQNRFWFTLLPEDNAPAALLEAPIWSVAGVATRHALLE